MIQNNFNCLRSETVLHFAILVLFYGFLIWVTILNLAFTLILWSLAKREYKLPPPHRLVLLAQLVNKISICNVFEREKVQLPDGSEQTGEVDSWQQIFAACNNIRVLAFLFIYIVGCMAYFI